MNDVVYECQHPKEMALKMRKDIKKSSYYVWFLGAQESKGLRGSEYVVPVVKSLILRERNVEPFKVTLQVSHKGLKIIQNVPQNPQTPKSKKPEIVKHFIPHHAVTCVLQDVDIVSCILLLYNPVTKCPVHVHAYRCDSVETAEILKGQLQTLIERPENQKKLGEIETRLQAKGLLLPANRGPAARRLNSGGGSDGRSTSTRESESSGGSSSERLSGGNQERITNMYDSLAAELREKLGSTKRGADAPILLPPRDYDTVHRQKGNLTAIDLRRCLNTNIVGVNVKKEVMKTKVAVISSGGSSGIGSDHAPSPDQVEPDQRYLDNQSTSDEEWTEHPSEDSLFLVQPGSSWPRPELSLPRARRLLSNEAPSTPSTPSTPSNPPVADVLRRRNAEIRQRTPSPTRPTPKLYPLKMTKSLNNNATISKLSPRDRFKDAKEKFLLLERERTEDQEKILLKTVADVKKRGSIHEMPISPVTTGPPRLGRTGRSWSRSRDSEDDLEDRPTKEYIEDCEDDIFEHGYPKKNNLRRENSSKQREAYVEDRSRPEEERLRRQEVSKGYQRGDDGKTTPVRAAKDNGKLQREREDKTRQVDRRMEHYGSPDDARVTSRAYDTPRGQSERRSAEYSPDNKPRRDYYSPERNVRQYSPERNQKHYSPERKPRRNDEYSPERKPRKPVEYSPERKPRKSAEYSPERKPRKSMEYIPEKSPVERVLSPSRNPRPTPRNLPEEDKSYQLESRYRGSRAQVISQIDDVEPVGRYRSPARNPLPAPRHVARDTETSPDEQRRYIRGPAFHAQEKKRRSMFDVMEDERRKSSNELAKEFKRRSYHDGGSEISADLSRSSHNLDRDYRSHETRNDNFDSNRRSSQMDLRGGHVDMRGGRPDPRDMRSTNSIEAREMRNNQNNHLESRGRDYDHRDVRNGPMDPRMDRGRHGGYQEIADQERFPGLDRETARHVGNKNVKKAVADARYRHSYAEPGLPNHLSLSQVHHDMLHRTNSTVSSGRVGIAAVHPY